MGTENFSGRLKELREQLGLTQQQLADQAGISKAGVADLEQGKKEPAWATVVALGQALGVDCRAFLEEPTSVPEPKRGRPRKEPEATAVDKPKRPRGRPRKGA